PWKYKLQVVDSAMRRESRHFKTSPSFRTPAQSLCTYDARRAFPIVAGEFPPVTGAAVVLQDFAPLDWRHLCRRSYSRTMPTPRWYGTVDIEQARRQVARQHKTASRRHHKSSGICRRRPHQAVCATGSVAEPFGLDFNELEPGAGAASARPAEL